MLHKTEFKLFIWFLATAFFFMASAIVISFLQPGPTESQIMQYMAGMMNASENSLMGLSMMLEEDSILSLIIVLSASITIPLLLLSVLAGVYVRFVRRKPNAAAKE